jgi:hypothetical protein
MVRKMERTMKAKWALATILTILISAVTAAVPPPPPPNLVNGVRPPPPPPACIPQNPAEYVPNADGTVPADVMPQSNVLAGTQIFTGVRTQNPRVPGAGVIVNLPGLALPRCPAPPVKSKVRY